MYKRYTNVYKNTTLASVERSADTGCVEKVYTNCVGDDSSPLGPFLHPFALQDSVASLGADRLLCICDAFFMQNDLQICMFTQMECFLNLHI